MFLCENCKETSLPGQSPTLVVVRTEAKEYLNYNTDREPIMSVGSQITMEAKVCPKCLGNEPKEDGEEALFAVNVRGVVSALQHSRRCNKLLGDCFMCKNILKFLETVPLHHLSAALSEPPTVAASFSFGTLILDSWLQRQKDNKKDEKLHGRQLRDVQVCGAFLKGYERSGGRIGSH